MNDHSKIYYYLILSVVVIACVLLTKFFFQFLSNKFDRSILIYIFAAMLLLFAFIVQYIGFRLGVSIGESNLELEALSTPKTINGQLNLVLHGAIIMLYPWIFGNKQG